MKGEFIVKKIVKIVLAMIIIFCAMITSVNATFSGKVDLKTTKTEFKANEEFVVEANLSNVVTDKGIIALGATLEYDKSALTFVKIEGTDNWSKPTYNEANGKLVTDRGDFATGDETVFKITFKANENIDANTSIKLKDISVADGDMETILADTNITLSIKKTATTDTEKNTDSSQSTNNVITNNNSSTNSTIKSITTNQNTNTVANQSTSTSPTPIQTSTNSTSKTSLPYTGNIDAIFVVLISVIALVGIIFYIKIEKINKSIKEDEQ
jgi:hypothetical protein